MKNESKLFTPKRIGTLEIKNRFVRSATFENAAREDGRASDAYIRIYKQLSRGEIGLIVSGMMFTDIAGRSYPRQAGLHTDDMIEGYSGMTEQVRRNGARIFAQLCHGGRQSQMHGLRPPSPSVTRPDLIYKVLPRAMNPQQIMAVIRSFGEAAVRAQKAGFDGLQIHAAHGYLVSAFLSPYYNRRSDEWGGTSEKRFRLLQRIYEAIRAATGPEYPLTVKINLNDYTPKPGLSPQESAEHIHRLVELGIDAVEISCGTLAFSMFNQIRGKVPVRGFAKTMPAPLRPFARMVLKMAYPENRFAFKENYNLEASRDVKGVMKGTPLILVGGLRNYESMETIVGEAHGIDFISMSRPFIRQPGLVKRWLKGDTAPATCVNCNNCLAGVALYDPLRCYGSQGGP